ncbi:hypothetical protein, partial [Tranquillimonas alkanivorans]
MTGMERLKGLKLTAAQASYLLELSPELIMEAARGEETPQWLDYCLTGMETEYEEDPEAFAYLRLGMEFTGSSWSAQTVRATVPVLIEQARKGQILSYRDLDGELHRRDPSRTPTGTLPKLSKPLGLLGDVVDHVRREARDPSSRVPETYADLPPLEVLVVRGSTGLPGKGADVFLTNYLRDRGESDVEERMILERKALYRKAQADVFAHEDWDILLEL